MSKVKVSKVKIDPNASLEELEATQKQINELRSLVKHLIETRKMAARKHNS